MARPRLLDLFCGAGGAAMGYHRAGFDVVGVDVVKQPRYPFPVVQGDALSPPIDLSTFQAIHASPPCQAYSVTRFTHNVVHPELVEPTRRLLKDSGLPYIIENVVGAPLLDPLELCGATFGLTATDVDGAPLYLRRHRLFESNVFMWGPGSPCRCSEPRHAGIQCAGAYGGGPMNRDRDDKRGGYSPTVAIRRRIMDCDWMTQKEVNQAIPPAYTQFLGEQLLNHI